MRCAVTTWLRAGEAQTYHETRTVDERECGVRRAARQQDQEQRGQCRQCTAPLAVQLHRRGAGTWRGFAFGVAVPKVISCSGSDTIDSSNEQVAFAPPRARHRTLISSRVSCTWTDPNSHVSRTRAHHGNWHWQRPPLKFQPSFIQDAPSTVHRTTPSRPRPIGTPRALLHSRW